MDEGRFSHGGGSAVPSAHRLVVALDGSSSADLTLAWANRETAARNGSLRVVDCTRAEDQDLVLDEMAGAELLVVGAPAAGTGRDRLFGSVRSGARWCQCPVVVVRGGDDGPIRRIVVGVDGSSAAAAALDWAIDEAARHDADLTVVHAWQRPDDDRSMRGNDLRLADARCVVDLALRHCAPRSARRVAGDVFEGDAAEVLTAASADADLLVVGSRGRSGYTTMLFGSVALALVEAAGCPVAVLHPRPRP